MKRTSSVSILAATVALVAAAPVRAQTPGENLRCDFSDLPGAIWWGTESRMPIERLAAYAAPVFWHSPDEPELEGKSGADVPVPEVLPLETADGPVVYYQLKEIQTGGASLGTVWTRDTEDPGKSIIDLSGGGLLRLDFYAYYSDEAGLGAHKHDIEPVEFKIAIARSDGPSLQEAGYGGRCRERHHVILVTRVSGKAHGIEWFWNVLEVDEETKFQMYLFVEEGKHALATDKNSDGYFTPSYDVNVRVNDAWGVRDIIRSGGLFSGGYDAWMTKVRNPEDRVFPPLPDDSPLLPEGLERQSHYEGETAVYELRPLPPASAVKAWDEEQASIEEDPHPLYPFVADKEVEGWPEIHELQTWNQVEDWVSSGALKRSLSIALYADGDVGFSWMFPFFIVKNLHVGMSGGYILHRMYLTWGDTDSFGWQLLYTSSASRWVDPYFSAGAEWQENFVSDDGTVEDRTDFVLETGLKFRAQIGSSPLKFLSFLTDFWGFRAGIKNYGFFDIDRLTYVLEVGAGSF
ncbi:MAG: hypothetical protein M8858_04115 [marine benthic group bacterium]|nr:hypothetical protein [Gemmatimonadota bacterium]